MYIINTAKRLISFSWNRKPYRLMPAGGAVEVPDSAMNSAFLKSLIKDGSVAESSEDKVVVEEAETAEETAEPEVAADETAEGTDDDPTIEPEVAEETPKKSKKKKRKKGK